MRTLYLVRHGQASFGSHNYDQLSPIGQQQSTLLGQYFSQSGVEFDCVLGGTLQRHQQTWECIAQGLKTPHTTMQPHDALNEYNSDAIIEALQQSQRELSHTVDKAAARTQYFRNLRTGLAHWMAEETQPSGMPSYTEFAQSIANVLKQVQQSSARSVIIVSSGGPISTAIGQVLGLDAASRIDLNLQLRNSAICEIRLSSQRMSLHTFNTLPHLAPDQLSTYQTYA